MSFSLLNASTSGLLHMVFKDHLEQPVFSLGK